MSQEMKSSAGPDLALVMPAYNEAASLERVIREWWHELEHHTCSFIFIVIDDGSLDETPLVLSQLRSELGDRLISIRQKNRGHGQACLVGYRCAVGAAARYTLQIDSDGQCDPHYFRFLWILRNSSPLVYGNRIRRDDGAIRLLASAVLRIGVFIVTGALCPDPNVPYRLLETRVLATYLDRIPPDFVLANVALAVLLERDDVPTSTVPIRFRRRYGGNPSLRLRAFGAVGFKTLGQLRRLISVSRGTAG